MILREPLFVRIVGARFSKNACWEMMEEILRVIFLRYSVSG